MSFGDFGGPFCPGEFWCDFSALFLAPQGPSPSHFPKWSRYVVSLLLTPAVLMGIFFFLRPTSPCPKAVGSFQTCSTFRFFYLDSSPPPVFLLLPSAFPLRLNFFPTALFPHAPVVAKRCRGEFFSPGSPFYFTPAGFCISGLFCPRPGCFRPFVCLFLFLPTALGPNPPLIR